MICVDYSKWDGSLISNTRFLQHNITRAEKYLFLLSVDMNNWYTSVDTIQLIKLNATYIAIIDNYSLLQLVLNKATWYSMSLSISLILAKQHNKSLANLAARRIIAICV